MHCGAFSASAKFRAYRAANAHARHLGIRDYCGGTHHRGSVFAIDAGSPNAVPVMFIYFLIPGITIPALLWANTYAVLDTANWRISMNGGEISKVTLQQAQSFANNWLD